LRVVLIGFGAIAQAMCELWPTDRDVVLTGVLVRPGRAEALGRHLPPGVAAVESVADALALAPDLVAECAGHGAVREHCPSILEAGVDVATVSNGCGEAPGFNPQKQREIKCLARRSARLTPADPHPATLNRHSA
jgi:aspartate dehydrogenase